MSEQNRIGSKITTLRESLGLSVEELAERSGSEVRLIAGIENGELVPCLAPLIQITRALGVRLGTLLDDDTNIGPVVTRSGASESAPRVRDLETGATGGGTLEFFSLASGKTARHMEPFLIDVNPGEEHSLSTHEGEEFIFVVSGVIEVEYGKDVHILGAGDSIYYDSIVPHQVRAGSDSTAKILAVVYAPS
jgi:transcriptional regulator with XRE-family HTH domain